MHQRTKRRIDTADEILKSMYRFDQARKQGLIPADEEPYRRVENDALRLATQIRHRENDPLFFLEALYKHAYMRGYDTAASTHPEMITEITDLQ